MVCVYYSITSNVYSFSLENHLELVLKLINEVYKVGKSMSDDVYVMLLIKSILFSMYLKNIKIYSRYS